MGNLSALLSSFASSFGSKVLASLGMGFVSFAGYAVVVNALVSSAQTAWNGIGGDTLVYLSLAGFPTGFGIILGCIVTRTTLQSISSLGKIS